MEQDFRGAQDVTENEINKHAQIGHKGVNEMDEEWRRDERNWNEIIYLLRCIGTENFYWLFQLVEHWLKKFTSFIFSFVEFPSIFLIILNLHKFL